MAWNFPLGSLSLQITTWVTVGLLLSSLTLFAVKLTWALGVHPSDRSVSSLAEEETFHQPLKRSVGMTNKR
jgi:hypothetical protein